MLLLFQIPGGMAYLFIVTAVVTHFVSCCLYIIACCEHFKLKFQNLDQMMMEMDEEENEMYQKRNEINALALDIVSTHIEITK